MPFYDYKCTTCNEVMENQLKSFSVKEIPCKKEDCEGTAVQQFSGKFAAHGLPNGHNAVRVRRG